MFSINALIWILGIGNLVVGGVWLFLNRMNRTMLKAEHSGYHAAEAEETDEVTASLRSMQVSDIRREQETNERNCVVAILVVAVGTTLTVVQIVRLFIRLFL